MNIAVITSKFPFDGKEAFLYAEMTELSKRVRSLTIIPATPKSKKHLYTNLPGTVTHISTASPGTLMAAAAEFLRAPFKVVRVLLEVSMKPRSLRAKRNNVLIFPKAIAVARFVRRHQITHVHAYWLSTPSTIAYVCSRMAAISWSASGHRWDLVDTNLTSEPVAHAGFMNTAQFIRTISERGRHQVVLALGERCQGKVRKIHLGVDIPGNAPEHVSNSRPFTLVCIAGMEPVKGHVFLIDALARVHAKGMDVRCDLIGDGSLRDSLERQASSFGLKRIVNFLGWLPVTNIYERLRSGQYDVAILTSIDDGPNMCEGIPVSLMEAMANQIPCIATNSGSVNELVDDKVGFLVPQRNAKRIVDAILCLAHSPKHRLELGLNAAKRVREEFAAYRTAAALYALIKPASTSLDRK